MLSELPAEWRWGRLGELFSRVTRKNSAGCSRVLTASGEHGLIDQQEYFNKSVAGRDLSKYYHLKRGEFAYNRSSMNGYPVGAIKRLDQYDEGVLSTLYICFGLRKGAAIDAEFAAQLFDSGVLNEEIASITQVGARAHGLLNVKVPDFMEVSLPLPPLPEQKKIAAILSSVDEAIQATQAVIEQTRMVKEGLLQDLLTRGIGHTQFKQRGAMEYPAAWRLVTIGDVADVSNGSTPSRKRDDYWTDGTVPWVASGKVNDGVVTTPSEFITAAALESCSVKLLPRGTVIVGMIGQGRTRGMSARMDLEATINQNIAGIAPDPELLHSEFLHAYLQASYQELRSSGRGSNQDALNCGIIRRFPLPLPPMAEQETVAEILRAVDSQISCSESQLAQHRRVKAGLLQDLLTGKVRVSA